MADLRRLKATRAQLKGQLTRINNFLSAEQDITYAQAEARGIKLEELWAAFNDNQTQLEVVRTKEDEQLDEITRNEEGERIIFETSYYQAVDKVRSIMVNKQQQMNVIAQQGPQVSRADQAPGTIDIKLPTLTLPIFSGEYDKWMLFKDAFTSLIHDNRKLSPVQKFQYLRSSVKDEALQVISSLNTSAENYMIAWDLLKGHYENKKLIVNSHLSRLLDFPHVVKDKHKSLKQFIVHIRTHLKALEVLGQPVNQWNTIIIFLARSKLDYHSQREWEEVVGQQQQDHMPTVEEFIKFLNERCRTFEMLEGSKVKQEVMSQPSTGKRNDKQITLAATSQVCPICKDNHYIYNCAEFLKRSVQDRQIEVRKKQLCINCLKTGHYAKDCKSTSCRKCAKTHNTLLHIEHTGSHAELTNHESRRLEDTEKPVNAHCSVISQKQANDCVKDGGSQISLANSCSSGSSSLVLLATAQIYVRDIHGNRQLCRALLDPGSQSHLVTKELVSKLQIPCKKEKRILNGVMQNAMDIKCSTKICIESCHTHFKTDLDCLVLPTITGQLPQIKLNKKNIVFPEDPRIADPYFDKPGPIDLLIGASLFWRLLCVGQVKGGRGSPTWQKTMLGWVAGGEIVNVGPSMPSLSLIITNQDLQEQLERFWRQEELHEPRSPSTQESFCEEYFVKTYSRDLDGRFIVHLLKDTNVTLGSSKEVALKRFFALERRFKRQPALQEEYSRFLEDYKERGHMSSISWDAISDSRLFYFLPHQPVLKPDSISTKIRVVFDASTRTDNGKSLNDMLLPGCNLQKELLHIMLRFRVHTYVMTADIAMMFRQIKVTREDRNLQLILWRKRETDRVEVYSLNTVTYGTTCAPYLALRCLQQLGKEDGEQFPLALKALQSDFYMDDVLTGSDDLAEAIALQKQLMTLLSKGQFPLRKWRSNKEEILQHLTEESKSDDLLVISKDEPLKTLGLLWNQKTDLLQYSIKDTNFNRVTKRIVLSEVSQVYDPLGLLGPILIVAKIIMQQLWSLNIGWDESLPQEVYLQWKTYRSSLSQLSELKIPRCIRAFNSTDKFALFGFGDASERVYGACIYVVTRDNDGNLHSNLICAKSRVAPLKVITIAKLELCAALLLAKLGHEVRKALGNKISNTQYWSDSTVVIGWIRSNSSTLNTFVANRVSKIQQLTSQESWHHVPSNENPADIISKGTTAEKLKNNSLWWNGPEWLRKDGAWPSQPESILELPERKSVKSLIAVSTRSILPDISSFERLTRVIAYCHRFIENCRRKKQLGILTVNELTKAENTIARIIQLESFSQDIDCLRRNQPLKKNSKLIALDPFLDEKELIRVGGRLRHANLPETTKHPIILPSNHPMASFIFKEHHIKLHHCGTEQLLAAVRRKYWVLSGRKEARKITRSCLNCFRLRPTEASVKMGDLPKERVTGYLRPFTISGVDYAGPLIIRESRRRGRVHTSKACIALFICFNTKAIHLELVTSLTTEAFIAALRRFTGRRGICSRLFSDNGTNFVGAARELEELYEFLKTSEEKIRTHLTRQKIEWSFIPPRAPNFGGLWESAVKSVKRHFYAVTKGLVLTFEECYTLLVEVEAVVNSRPLTPCSDDPQDLTVLTPAHFLVGDFLFLPAQKNYLDTPDNYLSRDPTLFEYPVYYIFARDRSASSPRTRSTAARWLAGPLETRKQDQARAE